MPPACTPIDSRELKTVLLNAESVGLDEAVSDAIKKKLLSITQGANLLGINRVTMSKRLKPKQIGPRPKLGAPVREYFSEEEEKQIMDQWMGYKRLGVALSRTLLGKIVHAALVKKGLNLQRANTNGLCNKLLHKYETISPMYRITRTPTESLDEWSAERCQLYMGVLNELYANGFLSKATAVWNLTEFCFRISSQEKNGEESAETGAKNSSKKSKKNNAWRDKMPADSSRETLTVKLSQSADQQKAKTKKGKEIPTDPPANINPQSNLQDRISMIICGNAAGQVIRPLMLFQGELDLNVAVRGTNDQCVIGTNATGRIDETYAAAYFREEILPKLTAEKNVIFATFEHSNLGILDACMASGKNIRMIAVPSGRYGGLYPLDYNVFVRTRTHLRKKLSNLDAEYLSLPKVRNQLPAHLTTIFPTLSINTKLQEGFAKSGLYPYNPQHIRSVLQPNGLTSTSSPVPTPTAESPLLTNRKRKAKDVDTAPSLPSLLPVSKHMDIWSRAFTDERRKLIEILVEFGLPGRAILNVSNEVVRLAVKALEDKAGGNVSAEMAAKMILEHTETNAKRKKINQAMENKYKTLNGLP